MSKHNPGSTDWVFLFAGSISLAGQQWLMLWLIARTASPELVGSYGLAQACVMPPFAFLGLQLRSLMATEPRIREVASIYLRLRGSAMALALVLLGFLLVAEPFGSGSGALAAALGAGRFVELGSDFVDGLRHAAREYLALGVSQFLRASLSLICFASTWMSTASLVSALLGGAAAALVSAILLDLPILRSVRQSPALCPGFPGMAPDQSRRSPLEAGGRNRTGNVLLHALPLAFVQFLNIGVIYAPRVFLAAHHSMETVASFTCLATFLGVVSLAAGSYSASLAPAFAADTSQDFRSRLRRKALCRIAVVVTPVAILFSWRGSDLLQLVFGTDIHFPAPAVAWAALFGALWSLATVFGTSATAERRTILQLVAFLAALGTGSLSSWLLANTYGVTGAAFSLVVSAATLLAVYSIRAFPRLSLPTGTGRAALVGRFQSLFVERSSL